MLTDWDSIGHLSTSLFHLFSHQQLSCCCWPLVILHPGNTLCKISICSLCSSQKKNLVNQMLAKQYGFLCQIPDLRLKEVSTDPVKSTHYTYLLISLHTPWREGSLLESSRIPYIESSTVILSSDPSQLWCTCVSGTWADSMLPISWIWSV